MKFMEKSSPGNYEADLECHHFIKYSNNTLPQ